MNEQNNKERIEYVYHGRRWEGRAFAYLYAQTARHLFSASSQDYTLGAPHPDCGSVQRFSVALGMQSKRSNDAVGGVYETICSRDDEGRLTVHGPARYLRAWDDDDDIREWCTLDDIAAGQRLEHINHKAARDFDALGDMLAPVREIWLRTNSAGRRALLARIIERVTYR